MVRAARANEFDVGRQPHIHIDFINAVLCKRHGSERCELRCDGAAGDDVEKIRVRSWRDGKTRCGYRSAGT